VTPGSGEEAVVAFDPTDVGLGIADINWDFCFDNVTEQAVSISGATLSGKGDGVYILKNPNVAHSTTFRVHIVADGELKYAEGLFMASGGIGDESEIYLWREYEAGHNGDPAYAVPDVTVVAYSNDTASGDPITSGITDETGTAKLYLDPGTYYLFRRKSGWTFTNPQTIEVVNV
jgi:hypothetical protein